MEYPTYLPYVFLVFLWNMKEEVSPRFGGVRLGETVLNNVGERGGLLHDNARRPIIQSIDIRSCVNLD